jgi:UDP-N-acetylmuramate--alanine ligase
MVVEADESDRSFLKLSPAIAVVTNIDREHLEAYGSFDHLVRAFHDFCARVPFYGAVIACADDPAVRGMLPSLPRRTVTYGFSDDAQVRGDSPVLDGRGSRCHVRYALHGDADAGEGEIALAVPGRHNLQNALAAVAVGLDLGVPFERIRQALAGFHGAERRYQRRGTVAGVEVIDDYAHHPAEIKAVLLAARDGRPARVVAVFQPHRYSRTRDLMGDFGPALAHADVVVLTDIYPAGEAPLAGVTVDALADAARTAAREVLLVRRLDDVPSEVARLTRPGDLVLTLGAGSIGQTGDRILDALRAKAAGA